MTRKSTLNSNKIRYADLFIPGYGVYKTYIDRLTPYVAQTSERSDIIRTTVDATGWRKPSCYSANSSSQDAGYANLQMSTPHGVYRTIGGLHPNVDTPAFTEGGISLADSLWPKSSDVDRAVVMARNNVADRVASFAESLAELSSSIKTIGVLAQSLDKAIVSMQNKDWNKTAKSLGLNPRSRKARRARDVAIAGGETLASGFLAYNFGIKPIVSDIVSLMILMGYGKPLRCVGKGLLFTTKTESTAGVFPGSMPYNPFGAQIDVPYDKVVEAGVYVRLDYEIDSSFMRNLSSFGVTDVVQVGWALTPYSFVIDFALPVEEVLRSLTATFGLHFKGGTATKFAKRSTTYGEPSYKLLNDRTTWFAPPSLTVFDTQSKRIERTVFTSEPNPVTLWVKDPVSAFSVATVMSLMVSRFKFL